MNQEHKKYRELEKLTQIIGPSGYERDIQKYFARLMRPLVDKVYSDKIGNCYAEISGDKKLPRIMFNAHSDTIGFIIKHIDDKGFIFTQDLPGVQATDYRMLPGCDILVLGRKTGKVVHGQFIPTVPLHKLADEELMESINRDDLAIDIGANSLAQAKRAVNIGDYVVIKPNLTYQQVNGNHIVSANLDDRAGIFCMYQIAKLIQALKTKAPVTFVSTIREEDWAGSAGVAAKTVNPDISLTLDVTAATDSIRTGNEDQVAQKYGYIALDHGPALPRGPSIHDPLFLFLERICSGNVNAKLRMPYQVETDAGGAEHVQIYSAICHGIKAGSIFVPCRNTHTRIETVSQKDLDNTVRLAFEFYKQISRGNFKDL